MFDSYGWDTSFGPIPYNYEQHQHVPRCDSSNMSSISSITRKQSTSYDVYEYIKTLTDQNNLNFTPRLVLS